MRIRRRSRGYVCLPHIYCLLEFYDKMSPDKISRTKFGGQNVIGQNVETFCPRHFVHDILSTTYCPWHFVRDILSIDILSDTFCPVTFCPATLVGTAGQTKMGVRRIPIPEIQAMIACENCVWLVGLRSVG